MQTPTPSTPSTFPPFNRGIQEPARPATVEALELEETEGERCELCGTTTARLDYTTDGAVLACPPCRQRYEDEAPAPLELETCVHCGGDAIPGTTCPRSVDCPTCKGKAGGPCYRPSGHRAMELHAARVALAELIDSDRADRAAIADELEAATIAEDGQLGLSIAGDQLALEGLAPAPIVPAELKEWRA